MKIVRIVRVLVAVTSIASLAAAGASSVVSCESTTSPVAMDGGSTTPTVDGAVCACATPDCLPNCSDLPACKLECVAGPATDDGGPATPKRLWIDSCGTTDYAESCPNGCTDAATACP